MPISDIAQPHCHHRIAGDLSATASVHLVPTFHQPFDEWRHDQQLLEDYEQTMIWATAEIV
jgi:hypothetical protein